jgi:diguanylate cyclase (GGDEF)-like protein/PAS domain S-box-containing protein
LAETTTPPRSTGWLKRLHAAFMPDYNRAATTYWWLVASAGTLALGYALWETATGPRQVLQMVAAGTAISMLAGFFPVRIRNAKNSFAAGEIFIFLLLLLHGTEAATVAAAGEAAVGSWRTSKRWTSRIASPAIAGLAMTLVGSAFEALVGGAQQRPLANAGWLITGSMLLALSYFVVNTMLIAAVPRLKRGEYPTWADLIGVFGWVGVAYSGSAVVAALLYLVHRVTGMGVLMGMLPLLATLLATLHYLFRQQEAAEMARQVGAEAAAREADLAERHVRELAASERRFHSAFTHASIGMALLDFDGHIRQANPALRHLLGHDEAALTATHFQDHALPSEREALEARLSAIRDETADGFALELRCRHSQGAPVWVALHCSHFSEPGASKPCLILQVQDISARRQAEEELHRIAFQDALTGLPNRRRFNEMLRDAVQAAQREEHDAFALMFLDFDRFKLINDSLGHDAGDQFLIQVARRIQEALRPHDVVARLGGDEFAVLVRHIEQEHQVASLADRLLESLRRPCIVAGTELTASASIGITFSRFGYTSPEAVLRDADTAMYKAKAAGKARYALFDTSLHTAVARRLRMEGELRHAIEHGKLDIHYQPIFELASGQLAGFEALVRWFGSDEGSISPTDFLPVAEDAGLMLRISDFVLNCACRQLRAWHDLGPEHAHLRMNVNISGGDLAHPALIARVTRALVESGLAARHLTLELTENILMARLEQALSTLGQLRQLGVELAVDDFGTGYSSLAHLATLPIDSLKIDRGFVTRLAAGAKEAAVVRSIVGLGGTLGKAVVAEGIESDVQLEELRAMGCTFGQGFLLGHPAAAAAITDALSGRNWHSAHVEAQTTSAYDSRMLH